jgi:hypothetical protein
MEIGQLWAFISEGGVAALELLVLIIMYRLWRADVDGYRAEIKEHSDRHVVLVDKFAGLAESIKGSNERIQSALEKLVERGRV